MYKPTTHRYTRQKETCSRGRRVLLSTVLLTLAGFRDRGPVEPARDGLIQVRDHEAAKPDATAKDRGQLLPGQQMAEKELHPCWG
jgi:hypothetical protein